MQSESTDIFALFQAIVVLLMVIVMVFCMPSDTDPADPDVGSNYSPTDLSGTIIKKKKLKKLLILG
jgi:hypothetical protein